MATESEPSQASPPPAYVGETKEHLAAFQLYLSMGASRSLSAVAEKIKTPERTVNRWSKKFDWHKRVLAIQEEETERANEQIKKEYFRDSENLRTYKYELLEAMKARVSVEHKCPSCKAGRATIGEIVTVFNVVKTELGEPTSIAKGTWTEDKPNPFEGIFSKAFRKKDESAGNS